MINSMIKFLGMLEPSVYAAAASAIAAILSMIVTYKNHRISHSKEMLSVSISSDFTELDLIKDTYIEKDFIQYLDKYALNISNLSALPINMLDITLDVFDKKTLSKYEHLSPIFSTLGGSSSSDPAILNYQNIDNQNYYLNHMENGKELKVKFPPYLLKEIIQLSFYSFNTTDQKLESIENFLVFSACFYDSLRLKKRKVKYKIPYKVEFKGTKVVLDFYIKPQVLYLNSNIINYLILKFNIIYE